MKKIGRLRQPIARELRTKCADICISDEHIIHISNVHRKELEQLGMSALDYVQFVVSNFNQIRQGSNNSLLLVVYNNKLSHTAAIALNYSMKNGFWEVKTAQPRRLKEIERKKLLWRDCPSPK